jgi:hypothetical protein
MRNPQSSGVEPELLAEIEYRAKSAEGKVLHPFSRVCARIYECGPGCQRGRRRHRDCFRRGSDRRYRD